MKRILFLLVCVFMINSCADATGTLIVDNKTAYLLRIFTGTNSLGDFIGEVGPNTTKSIIIDFGYTVDADFITAVAQNCSASTCAWQYNVGLKRGDERTIVVP